MMAVTILAILAAVAGWLLWGHLKHIQTEDLERNLLQRANKRPNEPHDDDLEK